MKWKRKSGQIIETNDLKETVKHCKAVGWMPLSEDDPKPETPDYTPKKEDGRFRRGKS